MTRAGVSELEKNRRLRLAAAAAAAGGNATTFGHDAGLSPAAAANWLSEHDADLHRYLTRNGRGRSADRHQALVTLLLLKSVEGFRGGQKRLARALGVTSAALCQVRKRWAPDGLDAGIANLMPDDDGMVKPLNGQPDRFSTPPVHEAAHV
jgi:hypothetical protein